MLRWMQHPVKCYYLVLILLCSHFAVGYTLGLKCMFNYHRYAFGDVNAPFYTRPLMAWVFQAVLRIRCLPLLLHHFPAPLSNPLTFVTMITVFASLFVSTECVRLIGRDISDRKQALWSPYKQWFALIVPWMAYAHFLLTPEMRVQTPYDVLQVAVFSVGLLAIMQRRIGLLYPVLVIGTLNRETTCFLILWYVVLESASGRSSPGKRTVLITCHGLIQVVLWMCLRWLTAHWFHKPPTLMTVHWQQHLRFLANPFHWPTMASVFGFLWIPFAAHFGRIPHLGLKRCAVFLLPWFLIMIYAGDLIEIRIYSEWIPYIAVCLTIVFYQHLSDVDARTTVDCSADPIYNA